MARIIAIDYGQKRTGVAVTDPLQIIPQPLTTVPSEAVIDFLRDYVAREAVEVIVVGLPPEGSAPHRDHRREVVRWIRRLRQAVPHIPIETEDESFTSRSARRILLEAGARKSQRRRKENVDKVSASLILERFLERRKSSIP